tara:strand:+ start:780 stop:959 length:180 start_codon:yes stop_codon:yes gene_type:complete
MKLTFDNGYVVNIIHPEHNSFLMIPEVGYWKSDEGLDLEVISFQTAEELMHILIQIEKL